MAFNNEGHTPSRSVIDQTPTQSRQNSITSITSTYNEPRYSPFPYRDNEEHRAGSDGHDFDSTSWNKDSEYQLSGVGERFAEYKFPENANRIDPTDEK
jgi:hypothetical protein